MSQNPCNCSQSQNFVVNQESQAMEISPDTLRLFQNLGVPSRFKHNLQQMMDRGNTLNSTLEQGFLHSPPSISDEPRYLPN